jgi:Arm DNA-binding domain
MPLTDVKCRNAKRKIKPHKLSDGGGLHLLVNTDGAKYWRLAYRWHGKQRTLALGVYPAVGLVEARAARDDVDPSIVKRERKRAAKVAAGNTFEAVAREWHENWKGARTPYYAGQILRRLEADVFPTIGRRPIAELEPSELLDMLRKVEKRGVNETARRLKQLVGQIFRFAIVTGRAKRDPSADLKDALRATGEPQRHRAMPLLELPTFLQKLETYSGELQTKLALKLVTLTFLRTTELRAGRWNELEDLEGKSAQWRVPHENATGTLGASITPSGRGVARTARPLG